MFFCFFLWFYFRCLIFFIELFKSNAIVCRSRSLFLRLRILRFSDIWFKIVMTFHHLFHKISKGRFFMFSYWSFFSWFFSWCFSWSLNWSFNWSYNWSLSNLRNFRNFLCILWLWICFNRFFFFIRGKEISEFIRICELIIWIKFCRFDTKITYRICRFFFLFFVMLPLLVVLLFLMLCKILMLLFIDLSFFFFKSFSLFLFFVISFKFLSLLFFNFINQFFLGW